MVVPVRCRIPELVLSLGQNQQWLADVTGISRQRISDYARMRYLMNLVTAKVIATALKCRIEDLYEWGVRQE